MEGIVVLCFFYALLAVLVTAVSILTIAVFSRKKLRRRSTSFLLIGLTVADLLIGTLVLPLFITITLTHQPPEVRLVSYYLDIITGLASIFTIAVISLERMCAVCFPFRHQMLSRCTYIVAVCVPWILAISGLIMVKVLVKDHRFTSVFFISSLVLPLVIISTSYSVIWVTRHRSSLQEEQERKLAKTLLIIIGAFVVTWLPFQVINTYIIACRYSDSCEYPPGVIIYIAVFLRLSNSFLNFMVYSLRMPDFREQLRKLCPTMQGKNLLRRASENENRESDRQEGGRKRFDETQTVNFELTQL